MTRPNNQQGVPDYHEVLAENSCTPMDLGTIEKKLDASTYKGEKEFVKDVRKVFFNASVYNPVDDVVYLMAEKVMSLATETAGEGAWIEMD